MQRRNLEFYYGSFIIVLTDDAPVHFIPLVEEGVCMNGNQVRVDHGSFQSMMGVLQFYSACRTPFFLRCEFVHRIMKEDLSVLWRNWKSSDQIIILRVASL